MFITFHWKEWFNQTGWSIGYCQSCERTEALRIGRVIKTGSLYHVVPITHRVGAEVLCCDFCGREANRNVDAEIVGANQWNYRDGIATLFSLCSPGYDFGPLRFSKENEIVSLLQATTRATRYSKIDLNAQWFPPLIGATIGAALATVLALQLSNDKDAFRVISLALLGGGFVGGLIGILAGGILCCDKVARTTIEYNVLKYQIDRFLLTDLAAVFPRRIRRAVHAIAY